MIVQLLHVVLVGEMIVVAVGLLWLAGHVAVRSDRRRRSTEALRRARELLRVAVLGDLSSGAAVTA